MLIDRFISWMTVEPAVGLMMIIAAIVIFGASFVGSQENAFWPWVRRVIEAAVRSLLFLGLLWAFRAILNDNYTTFNSTHGSVSQANLQSARSIWGQPHIQRELSVNHWIETVEQEEIPREDPSQPPLYRNIELRKLVPQNSILSFSGQVDLTLSEREKGYAYYSGFEVNCRLEYEVINDSDLETEAEFNFPLSPNQTMYESFQITVDGQDISSQLRVAEDNVWWKETMKPQERQQIAITYTSRGMDYFYYQVPVKREIKDFKLTLMVDRLPVSMLNYPEGCLTPKEIRPTLDGQGSILMWTLDRAITTAGMGVALPSPEQPGADVIRVLWRSPYALTLLIATLGLTLLIRGEPVRFLDLALLASTYCVQFLVMAAISDFFFGFWGSLIVGAILTGLMAFLLFRKHPSRLLRILVLILVAFFAVLYPLSGLLSDVAQRNSFEGGVQAGLIVYLFGLSLYTRLSKRRSEIVRDQGGA
jgi:hypothetical protein